jgi:hypothetical protein
MKKIILIAGLAMLSAGWSGTALAGYSSGCGVGALIFEGQSGIVPNVLAMTTNGTYWNGTFGMSTGTLGCDTDGVVLNEHERTLYAATNLRSLKGDMARGQGEYLDGLASLMGVGEADRAAFASLSQTSLPELLEADDASGFLATLDRRIAADPALAHYVTATP